MSRTSLQVSIRAATAAGLAVGIAQLLKLEFPTYSLISAIIVTDLAAARTRQLGVPRLVGTVVGAILGAALSPLSSMRDTSVLIIGAGVFAAIMSSDLLHVKEAGKVAGYVCGVVLLNHSDQPWSYALYRVLETALGIGAGVSVSLVPKLLGSEIDQADSAG